MGSRKHEALGPLMRHVIAQLTNRDPYSLSGHLHQTCTWQELTQSQPCWMGCKAGQ
jgi:hypothetical protein